MLITSCCPSKENLSVHVTAGSVVWHHIFATQFGSNHTAALSALFIEKVSVLIQQVKALRVLSIFTHSPPVLDSGQITWSCEAFYLDHSSTIASGFLFVCHFLICFSQSLCCTETQPRRRQSSRLWPAHNTSRNPWIVTYAHSPLNTFRACKVLVLPIPSDPLQTEQVSLQILVLLKLILITQTRFSSYSYFPPPVVQPNKRFSVNSYSGQQIIPDQNKRAEQ